MSLSLGKREPVVHRYLRRAGAFVLPAS
jgi:hypothetical protein